MKNSTLKIILSGFFVLGFLQANDLGVEVRPNDKELFESEPRKIVTTDFRVTNKTLGRQEFISEVELPEGWILITEDFPFELNSSESVIKTISFFIPQNALADEYEVTYRVRGWEFPSMSDFFTIRVVVLPAQKLKITLPDFEN